MGVVTKSGVDDIAPLLEKENICGCVFILRENENIYINITLPPLLWPHLRSSGQPRGHILGGDIWWGGSGIYQHRRRQEGGKHKAEKN